MTGLSAVVFRARTVAGLACVMSLLAVSNVRAQGSRRQPAPVANGKALDQQADKVLNDYLSGLADLATRYEDVGDTQKSSEMLRSILKVKPDADVVKARLKQLEEAVFTANIVTVDVDAGAGWVPAGVLVTKGKPVRFEVDGTYRLNLSDTIGPDGYVTHDLARDVAKEVPFGALMGMVGKSEVGNSRRNSQKDAPHPFAIGAKREVEPSESGPLFFRINLPPSSKATGKFKVRISGNVLPTR